MKYLTLLLLTATALLSGCQKDILDKTDLSGLDERIWDSESTATLYLNTTYAQVMPTFPNMRGTASIPTAMHHVSDENNTGDTKVLFGTLGEDNITDFSAAAGKNNAYGYIRRVNTLLEGVNKGVMDDAAKRRVKGQAYFLRAWVYFQLVKLYGGVPIVARTQDWQTDDLNLPRRPTKECFEFITTDLDSAATMLAGGIPGTQATSDRGRITRDIALAVKGRVLLYWASPQFNPTNIADRWDKAYLANKLAYETLTATGAALFTSYSKVLTDKTSSNREVIMIRSFIGSTTGVALLSNVYEQAVRPPSEKDDAGSGSFLPTWELVRSYPMSDGTASIINGQASNGFDSVLFWKNRDPRFAETIAYNGSVWELSNKTGRRQWNYNGAAGNDGNASTGFYSRKFVNTATMAVDSKKGKSDWVEMRLAEVMLNLAECANATGKISEAYDMLALIRKRAGIKNNDGKYGLTAAMSSKQTMDDAIMLERQIELAFEGKRYDDLRRTRRFHLLNNRTRHGMKIAINTATKINNVALTAAILEQEDAFGVKLRDKINMDDKDDYLKYFVPTYTEIDKNDATNYKIKFLENQYYFYAIPLPNLQKNPNLQQTINWTGGTFNPLAE